ncbi:MAG: polysaccharide deacetylase family protein [Oscillospiraceae bacterium]|nr:polysaccharide deacetylase family protein [Oscillospiraceae bacterium]
MLNYHLIKLKLYKNIAALFLTAVLALSFCTIATAADTSADDTAGGGVRVPVLMYHSLHHSARDKWVLPPDQFEADLRYLSENGYTAVFASDLAEFVHGDGALPEKPILLTFDDGVYNNYTKALPLLEKYDMRIVLSVIGSAADLWTSNDYGTDEEYGHCTWQQLAEMSRSGRVELSSHTQNLHNCKNGRNGCTRKKGESQDEYREMLAADLRGLQEKFAEHCGVVPICFAYPFGAFCPEADEVLEEMGFTVTLSCYEKGANLLQKGEPGGLRDMYRFNRGPGRSAEKILTGMK